MTTPYLVTKSQKNIGIAILLTFLFGPLGLLYASISGGIIMILIPICIFFLLISGYVQENTVLFGLSSILLIIFALTDWIICIAWAVLSVIKYNKAIEEETNRQFEIWDRLHEKDQNQVLINVDQKSLKINSSGHGTTVSFKPSLQEWAKSNPGKSINDYYAKFGR